jgi:hypothetical protein
MTRALREFLPELQRTLGIYVPMRSFATTCAFILGYKWGSGDEALNGFQAWLLRRGNGRPELSWPWLVLCEMYPQDQLPEVRKFSESQNEEAIRMLFELLTQYLSSSNLDEIPESHVGTYSPPAERPALWRP